MLLVQSFLVVSLQADFTLKSVLAGVGGQVVLVLLQVEERLRAVLAVVLESGVCAHVRPVVARVCESARADVAAVAEAARVVLHVLLQAALVPVPLPAHFTRKSVLPRWLMF